MQPLELGWYRFFKSVSVFGFSKVGIGFSKYRDIGFGFSMPSPSPKMGNGVPKICIAICSQAVTASDIVTIDSLPPSLSICAISDPLSLPVPPTWGARFHDCRPKRQCAGDAAFSKLLWPLLRLIMVSLPLPGVVEFHIFIS